METHTTTGADLVEQLSHSVWHAQVNRLRRFARAHISATVRVDIDPVDDATTALCDDDSEPATITVSFDPGFEGAQHVSRDVCLRCAERVMRDAVEAHRTTYLDVEVRRMDTGIEATR